MNRDTDEIKRLISDLNSKKAIIITGAGVTSASIDNKQRSNIGSWTSLLKHGIQFCCNAKLKDPQWGDEHINTLANSNTGTDELLAIGDEIWDCLIAAGKINEWLTVFDNAEYENAALVQAIKRLAAPVATANYDKLIEDITGYTAVTLLPEDRSRVQHFADTGRKHRYVLHLHGYYQKPDSIVFGKKSYNAIVQNEFAQFINRYLVTRFESVLFVGFGYGVYDPNFSLIFKWVSDYLPVTRLYHLVLNKDVAATREAHENRKNKNVIVLGYGDQYADLASFTTKLSAHIDKHEDLPKTIGGRPDSIGRQHLIEEVAGYCIDDASKPVGIIGTAGIGKTNLALNVLHHQMIANVFGIHRYFIRCDGAGNLSLLYNALLNALEITTEPGIDAGQVILNHLQYITDKKLLLLDNFETPWDNDTTAVKEFVERLQTVALVMVTFRGGTSPAELHLKTWKLHILSPEAAEKLFHTNSDEKFTGNPLVGQLVKEVDYLPLAIELMAKRGKSVEKAETLYDEWQKRRNQFLKMLPKQQDKNYNLEFSIQLSYESPRLDDDNRSFLKALCFFPSGLSRDYLEQVFANAYDLLEIQKYVGLCEEDAEERITILSPVREFISEQPVNDEKYLLPLLDFYYELIHEKSSELVWGEGAYGIFQAEWLNIIRVIEKTISTEKGIQLLVDTTHFGEFSGYYAETFFEEAVAHARQLGNRTLLADLFFRLSVYRFRTSAMDESAQLVEKALDLYKETANETGQADCYGLMGRLEERKSNNVKAESLFRQALKIYEKINNRYGIAETLKFLSAIIHGQAPAKAKNYLQQARAMYTELGSRAGQANCLKRLAQMEFSESNYTEAEKCLNNALELYRIVGDKVGEGNCLLQLGDVEHNVTVEKLKKEQPPVDKNDMSFMFRKPKPPGSIETLSPYWPQAMKAFEDCGSLIGQAQCLWRFGKVDAFHDNKIEAEALYVKAAEMFHTCNAIRSEGMVYVDLMGLFVFGNLNKSGKYGQYARQCFEEINRQDLIQKHYLHETPRLRKKREKIILPEPKKKASRKKRGG